MKKINLLNQKYKKYNKHEDNECDNMEYKLHDI